MLQLDALTLHAGDPATAAHAQQCTRCSDHLARVQRELPVPEWVRELGSSPRARARSRWWGYRVSAVLGSVLVIAIGAAALRGQRPEPEDVDPGAKGMPSVAVYIRRQGAVSLWDGQAPVRVGDGLQLKVAAGGYSRVTVSALQDGALTELYAGPASGETMLPQSWIVDDGAGPEILLVAFSRSPLTKANQEAALATLPRTRRLWATRLLLVKEGAQR